jgi:hypothetical protein
MKRIIIPSVNGDGSPIEYNLNGTNYIIPRNVEIELPDALATNVMRKLQMQSKPAYYIDEFKNKSKRLN